MTTPGGVPNLPVGALTLETLASTLQDMTPEAMRGRAVGRVSSIFNGSTGGDPSVDFSPLGILTLLFSGFNSVVANADPADIDGPEDLPGLLLDFIESLPVVGQFVDLLQAIMGTYTGDDTVLLQVQEIFALIRAILGGIDFADAGTLDPGAVWQTVLTTFIEPLLDVAAAVAQALLTAPLNAANLFGRIQLPQLGGGVPLSFLTTAVPNLLEPFTASSVPNVDGWSYDAGLDAAKVVADGSTKTLYLSGVPIKVEEGQPLSTAISVVYSGIVSGAGQTIRYVLETFTVAIPGPGDTATPVTVGAITNPSGTIGTPVSLGDSEWAIPVGVQSVRPVLVVDELVTAGTVVWKNTPLLEIPLLGVLADGLPAAIQARINEFQGLLTDLFTNPGAVLGLLDQAQVAGLPDAMTILNQIRDILAGLVVTPINSTIQDIKDLFNANLAKTQNLTTGGLFDASALTGLVDPAQVGGIAGASDIGDAIQQVMDTVAQSAGNVVGSGFGFADVFEKLAGLQQNVASANAALAQLQSDQTGNANSGRSVSVNFGESPDAASPPSVFTKVVDTGTGSVITSGGVLAYTGSSDTGREMYVYNVEELLTDYFEVSFVMPKQSTHGFFGDDGNNYLYAIGRSNLAGTTMTFARVAWDELRIGCIVSGSTTMAAPTWFGTPTDFQAPAGALIRFRGGTAGGVRIFQLLVNGATKVTVTDSGNVSQYGEDYRYCGLGIEAESDFEPGTMSAWSMNDNAVSTAVTGVGFRVARTSTTVVDALSGSNFFPANFFDTVMTAPSGITWDASTSKATVQTSGWYLVSARVRVTGTGIDDGNTCGILFAVNGTTVAAGQADTVPSISGSENLSRGSLHSLASVPLYLNAADEVAPFYNITTGSDITGDATGSYIFFAMAKMNG